MIRPRVGLRNWPKSSRNPPPVFHVGQALGGLVLLQRSDRAGCEFWLCRCECGAKVEKSAAWIANRTNPTCGAHYFGRVGNPHRDLPEHGVWVGIRYRCSAAREKNYGGRGITVCERWRSSFEAFYADMGPRPSADHSIERKDTNGHYEPDNCVWATSTTQNRNRRNVPMLEWQGRSKCRSAWAEELGITTAALVNRLRTMPLEVAMQSGPLRPGRKAA